MMLTISRKKVVLRTFTSEVLRGYLPQWGFVHQTHCELLDLSGKAQAVQLNGVKTIAYVKDFNTADATDPERIGRRRFIGRPRNDGLWLRLSFKDNDVLEGLVHFDMGFVDGLLEDRGLAVTPPDGRSNTYRVFVPRSALLRVEVLGFIGSAMHRKGLQATNKSLQGDLFDE
jgi:hypothetical protein